MSRLEFAKKQLEKYPEKSEILTELPAWVKVGKNVFIDKNVHFVSRGFGYIEIDGKLTHIPHSGEVIIENDVEITSGANIVRATADKTIIGAGTKINFGVHVAHNVKIGKNCLIIANSVIGGSAEIGDNCYIGIGALIKNKVRIGNNVTVGMGAVVLKDIPDNETWVGNPAKKLEK